MTMRVVHVASGREWRGGQRQVRLLARALARHPGLSQVVVTSRGSELARRLEEDGIPTLTPAWDSAFTFGALAATLRASDRSTILHAHDSHALAIAAFARGATAARLVATRRVDFPLRRTAFWRFSNAVIAVSTAVRDALIASGIPDARITVVADGIAVNDVAGTAPVDPRPSLGLPPGTPLVMATGALVGHKGHATMIRAARIAAHERPDLHWAVAGQGPLRATLESLVRELAIEDRVHLLGEVPEAVRLVAAADLFVMPSSMEGLGTSVLDAMALGVPVVGTRAGGIPEVLADGAGRLVEPSDPAALAAAVLEVLGSPELRQALVARAHEAVRRYSDEKMAEGVLRVYRSITSAH